jgi:hypothetical protein
MFCCVAMGRAGTIAKTGFSCDTVSLSCIPAFGFMRALYAQRVGLQRRMESPPLHRNHTRKPPLVRDAPESIMSGNPPLASPRRISGWSSCVKPWSLGREPASIWLIPCISVRRAGERSLCERHRDCCCDYPALPAAHARSPRHLHRKERSGESYFYLPSSPTFTTFPEPFHTAHYPWMEIVCSSAAQSRSRIF